MQSYDNEQTFALDDETVLMITRARNALEHRRKRLCLYCDGSLIHHHTLAASMGFATVYPVSHGYELATMGTAGGIATCTNAELAGLLSAITVCPHGRHATVYCDCKQIVQHFSTISNHLIDHTGLSTRSSAKWWSVIQEAFYEQGEDIVVEWVPAHSGILGNEAADRWARRAHTCGFAPWEPSRDLLNVIVPEDEESNLINQLCRTIRLLKV